MDVVPYQVTIGEKWLESGATHPEPRERRRWRPRRVDWGRPRRPLTLLAVGFGFLAFAVTAHAGIDDSDATTAAPATPPPAAAAAPVSSAVPTSDAMTTAAAEESQTVVSPQYPDENAVASPENAVASPLPAADVPSTQPDDAPAVDAKPEGSTSAPPQASERAANPLSITDAGSPPIRRAVQEDEPRAAQPSASASTAQSAPPADAPPAESWYRNSNSQYQFTPAFRKAASDVSVALAHAAIDRPVAFAQSYRVEGRLIPPSIPTSIINDNPPADPSLLASISATDLLEAGPCRALSGDTSGCATARQRYHVADPRYQPGRTVREAVSRVLVRLDETAEQLATSRTDLGRFRSPQPANVRATVRTTTPGEPIPVTTSGSFVSQAPAALARTFSRLTGPRPRDLPAVASAARIARGLGASLLPRLEALPRPRDLDARKLTGGQGADSRRLLQIGLALGIAYLVFLTFWFWGTRGRHRGLRGGPRL
jgi:hypothetical protein